MRALALATLALVPGCWADATVAFPPGLEWSIPYDTTHFVRTSIIEVLMATALMVTAVASLAQLFALSTTRNTSAKNTTFAAVLAQQKMEQLRGLAWGFDTLGLPVTDISTDISVVPEQAIGGTGLAPGGSLGQNVRGYCDFLDKNGVSLPSEKEARRYAVTFTRELIATQR